MRERRIIVRMKGSREIARRDMADQIKASCQTRRSRIDIWFANFCKLLQTLHAVAALNDKRGRCLGQIISKAHWLPFFSIFRLLGARRRWFLWPTKSLGEAVAPTTTRLWNDFFASTPPPSMQCMKRSFLCIYSDCKHLLDTDERRT